MKPPLNGGCVSLVYPLETVVQSSTSAVSGSPQPGKRGHSKEKTGVELLVRLRVAREKMLNYPWKIDVMIISSVVKGVRRNAFWEFFY